MIELPILKYKHEIKKLIKKNKLIIIKGETGCGKTTQVPQIINEIFFDKKEKKYDNRKDKNDEKKKKKEKKKMLISLPRRVATISVAERVSKEMKRGDIGNYVGYTIRFKNVCSDKTRIKFVTDGILIREIMNDPLLKKYKFLILDEIHERSIRTDVLLGYTKILLQKRKKIKIILMSATFDINIFNQFFNNPPIITIPHKLHKITIYYPRKNVEDYILSIVSTILQIHFGNTTYASEFENDDDHKENRSNVSNISNVSNGSDEKNKVNKEHELNESNETDHTNKIDEQNNIQTDTNSMNNINENINKTEDKNLGDILVFLPGQEEIEMVNIMLKEKLKIIYKGNLLNKLMKEGNNYNNQNDFQNKINNKFNTNDHILNEICFHFGNTEIIPDKIYNMKILQLYSSLPNKKQKIIFDPVPPNTRKVILSTNIAETSVTIPNIKYVIDSGKVKIKYFDVNRGSNVLRVTQISKDSAIQRSGRAGREAPGQVYRIYTKEEYENMNPFLIPEIFRSDLTQIYLELKAMNINNPLEFNFPENPRKELFVHSAKMLFKINAIDMNNNLTDLGKKLCLFPLNPIYANILLCSIEFNCIDEIATIIALLNCDSIFLNYNFYEDLNTMNNDSLNKKNNNNEEQKSVHKNSVQNSKENINNLKNDDKKKGKNNNLEQDDDHVNDDDNNDDNNNVNNDEDIEEKKINDKNKLINVARRKLIHPDGDHLTLLHIFYLWKEADIKEKKHFCNIYALNNEILHQVEKIKIQLLEIMKNKMKIEIPKKLHMHKWDQILICLCKACFFNIAKLTSNTNVYINLVNKTKIRIHPSSTLFNSYIKPTFIFYSDIVQTRRLYARIVTKIEADWLLKYVSSKFQVAKT
ncbi:ATP-dependent RNA helicase prh1, putative [Plasmodium sp. gorilla clade G2]|uniref:ATP-dependent RNA helicase prh1, putative n=1 Tax=Plasmodium sp. gorilla clade G2 TaxID=880535 RepID=UPI000D22211D|nr:ATP-dependent RNA helicase prh1, putative [Plasmodium sp. gorilla clade G2]SOV13753.1 ATP-dependent RNA helicase prh1, putative [Plasmodium sp. gorilla clade G2]